MLCAHTMYIKLSESLLLFHHTLRNTKFSGYEILLQVKGYWRCEMGCWKKETYLGNIYKDSILGYHTLKFSDMEGKR